VRDARWVGRVVLLAALGGTSFAEQGTAGTSGPDPCQLRDGDTVVVKTADDRTLRGAVNRLSTEALVLGGTGGVETVPRDRIQSGAARPPRARRSGHSYGSDTRCSCLREEWTSRASSAGRRLPV